MKNVRKTVDKILNVCILVLFIAMFGVTTLNVIMRYIFNSPLSFAVEFGRYTFAGMVYLGSIYVMRDDGHIGLDIVVDALPEPLHTIVKKFSRVLVLAYLAIFFCMSTRMVIENWTNRSSTICPCLLCIWPWSLAVPVCSLKSCFSCWARAAAKN